MSQQTLNQASSQDTYTRFITAINEEKLIKDLINVQHSKIEAIKQLASEIPASDRAGEIRELLTENLQENPNSIVSRLAIGLVDLHEEREEGLRHLSDLLVDFERAAKWQTVDFIAAQILEVDEENKAALRARVESTERLKGKKEARQYLAQLAEIDKKNPDVARKYGLAFLEEEPEKAVEALKSAAESYVRQKDYNNFEQIWPSIIDRAFDDLAFFDNIERILSGNKEKTRIAAYFMPLVEPYRAAEEWDKVIIILKKILQYEPTSTRSRADLVKAYQAKYADHSLLAEFLKESDLTNNKKPVEPCIQSFERNIVFDKDNYVFHRSRGVGKITSIDEENVIIDFKEIPGQRMSLQMAISSLQPLEPSHIWVRAYEDPEGMQKIFDEDEIRFFTILLESTNRSITLAEIKNEVVDKYLPSSDWSKWWSRIRTKLKKDSKFGFNPRKKDELIMWEQDLTLSDELEDRFLAQNDWKKKLDLALETLKNEETEKAAESCARYYAEQEGSKDLTRRVHSYLFLKEAKDTFPDLRVDPKLSGDDFKEIIKDEKKEALIKIYSDTPVSDFKRNLVDAIIENREDSTEILVSLLNELPIKIHRYIVGELNRLGETEALKKFTETTCRRYREKPEIFLWIAKSILLGHWTYQWVPVSREEVMLMCFRLLKPLVKLEPKGTRLKNQALDTIFGTTNITADSIDSQALGEIVATAEVSTLRRMAALFRDVAYVPDAHKDNFEVYLKKQRPDFELGETTQEITQATQAEDLFPDDDVILVSEAGLSIRKSYLDKLINEEIPQNSKDIGEAQEKGDLRENAEYKAAMERQSQLQAEVTKISDDLKKAKVIEAGDIRTDIVTIGTQTTVKTPEGESITYSILGPWEADSDKNVISYLSPLGKILIGKKQGDTAELENGRKFTIESIEKALA